MTGAALDARSAHEVARVLARSTVPRAHMSLLVGETSAQTIAFTMRRASLANYLRKQARGASLDDSITLTEMAAHVLTLVGLPLVLVTPRRTVVGALDMAELDRHEVTRGRSDDAARARVDVLLHLAAREDGKTGTALRHTLRVRYAVPTAVDHALAVLRVAGLIEATDKRGTHAQWKITGAGMVEAKRIMALRLDLKVA